MRVLLLTSLLLGAVPAAAAANAAASPPPTIGQETSIPDIHRDGFIDWRAEGRDALYVHAMNGKWYLVRTAAPCPRLRTAMALGFVASPTDRLDRYGAILAEGWRCQIASVTLSAPPPPRPR
ncbi:MAG: DUF6491 family protein, partial [Allosphingosinicella sp.]